MTNGEFYKEKLLKLVKDGYGIALNKDGEVVSCKSIHCADCKLGGGVSDCYRGMIEWLLAEHKEYPKLTKLQYIVLGLLSNDYSSIARCKGGTCIVCVTKLMRDTEHRNGWCWQGEDNEVETLLPAFDIFPFVKCEDTESWNIKELLENCEVEGD